MSIHKQQATAALLAATFLLGCLSFAPLSARPQQRDRSVTANQQNDQSQVPEPLMRIALSTNTRAANISTAAQLLNASDLIGEPQPLETSRVRVESRVLSPQDQHDQDIEITLARALTREDADRLIKSVREVTEEEAKAVVDSRDRWRVVVVKQSLEDGQAAIEKLEAAGSTQHYRQARQMKALGFRRHRLNFRRRIETARHNGSIVRRRQHRFPEDDSPNRRETYLARDGAEPRSHCFRRWPVTAAFQRATHVRVER